MNNFAKPLLMNKRLLFIPLFLTLISFPSYSQNIVVKVESATTKKTINDEIIKESVAVLNKVLNDPAFKDSLMAQSFVCTNKPSFCGADGMISGKKVYEDLIQKETLKVNLKVKFLWNPWRRWKSRTRGITGTKGTTIKTYTWWLKRKSKKERTIAYASHVGHELFHTVYFQYVHNPKFGSKEFVNDKDVSYKIDDILEALIRKHMN